MPRPINTAVVVAGLPESEPVNLPAMLNFLRIPVQNDGTSGDVNQDNLVNALIVGARQMAEKHTWRSLTKKKYVQYMDCFPNVLPDLYGAVGSRRVYNRGNYHEKQGIKLWYPPLINVEKIVYIGVDGTSHTMTPGTDFQVDFASEPGRVFPLEGQVWPETMYGVSDAVQIFFTAGYEVQSVTEPTGEVITPPAVTEPETDATTDTSPTDQVTSITVDRTIPETIIIAIKQIVVHWFQNRDPVIAQAGAGGKFATLPFHVEQILDTYRVFDPALVPER